MDDQAARLATRRLVLRETVHDGSGLAQCSSRLFSRLFPCRSRKTPPRVAHHLRHARALVSSAGDRRLRASSIQLNACQPSARQPSRCQKRFTSTGLHRIPTPLAGVLQAAQHRFCTCELTARFPSSQVQKWHPARWKTPARRPGDESGLVLVNGCPDLYPFTSTKPARLVPQVIRETTQMNR